MIAPATGDFSLNAEADTARFGAAIAGALYMGEAACLTGRLGAGTSMQRLATRAERGCFRAMCELSYRSA